MGRRDLQQVGFSDTDLDEAVDQALSEGSIIELLPGAYIALERHASLCQQIIAVLSEFHAQEPLRTGKDK